MVIQAFIVASSVLFGVATFLALSPIVRAIISPKSLDHDNWHRCQPRWQRLRETSELFRSLERWIVGTGYLIERHLPWFLQLPESPTGFLRLATYVFSLVFGKPKNLNQAIRVLNTVQPWSAGEVVACAWFLSAFTTALVTVSVLRTYSPMVCVVIAVISWMVSQRLIIQLFLGKAQQRRATIRKLLPHAMDTISMVVSSGDPFRIGLDTFIRDFADHPLSQEFQRLRSNLDRGQTMKESLAAVAFNVCLPEFDEMARVMGQMHTHGAPAAENFTRLAKTLRTVQLRNMEEEVGKSESQMALPMMMVLLSCILVAVAPFLLTIAGTWSW
jgi:Flp pilus assembly protein TadB